MNTEEDHTLITQQPLKKKKKEDLEIKRREKEELNKKLFLLQKKVKRN